MINLARRIDVIDLYVEDVDGTKTFYEQVFGLPGTRHPDCVGFGFGDTILHLRDVSTASEFIAPARPASRQDGSRGVFTIFVADVDEACADLAERGVRMVNGPAAGRSGLRSGCFADPSGQIWALAEDPARARERSHPEPWDRTGMRIGAVVLFAEDVDRAKSFYQDVQGLPPADQDGQGMTLGLTDVPGARELIGPAEVAGPEAGLRFTFCTFVDDVDAICAELAARGVPLFKDVTDFSFGHRLASVRDPAGHIWEYAGEIPAGSGRP